MTAQLDILAQADASLVDERIERAKLALAFLSHLPLAERVRALNDIRLFLHRYGPFAGEPVDCVQWVPSADVHANSYNPNTVAPPEMELLRVSIVADGYTQPIVVNAETQGYEVVDGFHRNRVGKECEDVVKRISGYLPVVQIRTTQQDVADRMASTIRHNRARGKHRVDAMSDIVVELKRRNWSDDRIAKNLGMEPDEILRLVQITGLVELFTDQEFSRAWDVEGAVTESDFVELTDDIATYGEETEGFRTVNTSDEGRIFHTYEKWECYAAGFYATTKEGMTATECESAYQTFLADGSRFAAALDHVVVEWKHSCEHYLTNTAMNRIAWLGQAAACYAMGIPAQFRGGFYLLTPEQQATANGIALDYLNRWLAANQRPAVTLEEAYSGDRQSDIY